MVILNPFQENEVGVIEYPEIARIIDWIDNFVVVFFSLEYIVRYSTEDCSQNLT